MREKLSQGPPRPPALAEKFCDTSDLFAGKQTFLYNHFQTENNVISDLTN